MNYIGLAAGTLLMLLCMPGGEAQGIEGQKDTVYVVTEMIGVVMGHATEAEPLHRITINAGLSAGFLIEVGKGSSLKLRSPAGNTVTVNGPAEGTLRSLESARTSGTEDFVRQTLNKVPGPQNGEKKIDISTPPSGLTKAAKVQRRPMPYIWKVKQTEKKTESK